MIEGKIYELLDEKFKINFKQNLSFFWYVMFINGSLTKL
jgi:hypothetical protein